VNVVSRVHRNALIPFLDTGHKHLDALASDRNERGTKRTPATTKPLRNTLLSIQAASVQDEQQPA